jgi:hypothetical protein
MRLGGLIRATGAGVGVSQKGVKAAKPLVAYALKCFESAWCRSPVRFPCVLLQPLGCFVAIRHVGTRERLVLTALVRLLSHQTAVQETAAQRTLPKAGQRLTCEVIGRRSLPPCNPSTATEPGVARLNRETSCAWTASRCRCYSLPRL